MPFIKNMKTNEDAVVVIGYYKAPIDQKEFSTARLAIPIHGPTVFCGYLRAMPIQKMEIYLHWNEENMPVVVMYAVEEYGDEVRFVLRGEPSEEEDLEVFWGEEKENYECAFFRVSSEDFYEKRGQPFVIWEDRFEDSYSIAVLLDEEEEARIDIDTEILMEEGMFTAEMMR